MAHIQYRPDKTLPFKAIIKRKGIKPYSKSFREKKDAKLWAIEEERSILLLGLTSRRIEIQERRGKNLDRKALKSRTIVIPVDAWIVLRKIKHSDENDTDSVFHKEKNGKVNHAILYQDDFNRLMQMGIDPRWNLTSNQIFERGRARVSIARLVANAGKGDKVQYLDRDPCNLKTENLVISPGGGKYSATDKLDPLKRPTKFLNTVELRHKHVLPSWERANA